ncbi:hypothetical protein BIZ42_17890 [Stenotrophomonas sp. LM091]|nr:hypothetical protein BIZ42_17890 [Stenotrophomonas sp. LM091]
MLSLIEHSGIHLITNFQLPRQLQQLLLSLRKLLNLALEARLSTLKLANLSKESLVGRMISGELSIHLSLLQAKLLDARLDSNFLVQESFSLQR